MIIVDGCLGEFSSQLKVGDTQKIVSEEGNHGPYFIQNNKREKLKNDIVDTKFIIKAKSELMSIL